MKLISLLFAFLLLGLSTPAEARHRLPAVSPECNVTMPCDFSYLRVAPAKVVRLVVHNMPAQRLHYPSPTGLVAPLAAKVSEIVSTCGSTVISSVRHTLIAGTRILSLHASGKAADLQGNPSCMYAALHGWPGGYSIDYASVRHIHISYDPEGGREMGARFVHGGHHHRHRYAARAHGV
jgi:hypothetical protein